MRYYSNGFLYIDCIVRINVFVFSLRSIHVGSASLLVCLFVCLCVCVCVCVCVCMRAHVTADFRGQFCVFNPLTGDIRKVGTSPVVFTIPTSYHILDMFGIFNAYSKKEPAGTFKNNCVYRA